jgi:hypothetical protein
MAIHPARCRGRGQKQGAQGQDVAWRKPSWGERGVYPRPGLSELAQRVSTSGDVRQRCGRPGGRHSRLGVPRNLNLQWCRGVSLFAKGLHSNSNVSNRPPMCCALTSDGRVWAPGASRGVLRCGDSGRVPAASGCARAITVTDD